ncbi:MAG: GAF domain-containing protein [Anaerolineae bacterium]|nr:GAF domain-containing protein [Anaerolineae bacterium]
MTDTPIVPPLDLSQVSPERQRLDFELVFSISTDIITQSSLRELLNRAVERVREGYGLYHAQIYLFDPDINKLLLAGSSGEAGRRLLANGHRIDYNNSTSIVTRAAREQQPVLVNDVDTSETFLPNPLLPDIASELAVPMVSNGVLVGVLDIQSAEANRFTAHDVRVQTLLAEQLAIAVQNARYTERMARYTVNMNTAFEVGREIARQRTSTGLLWDVANLCKTRFGLYHVHIYLYDADNHRLTLRAASGDIGQQQVERGHAIPLSRVQSIVARAARERHPVVASDVTLEEFYLPNPLLPPRWPSRWKTTRA